MHEKRGSGGSTSWSLQPKGCQGSQVGPADNVARLPLASPQLQGRGCSIAIWPCRAPCIPSPSALLLLAGRKQLTRSHLELLIHCCLACRSLVPSAGAGKAPWLPLGRWFGTRSLLQASPPWGPAAPLAHLTRAMLSPTATLAKGGCWHCHLSVWREGPEGFRCR